MNSVFFNPVREKWSQQNFKGYYPRVYDTIKVLFHHMVLDKELLIVHKQGQISCKGVKQHDICDLSVDGFNGISKMTAPTTSCEGRENLTVDLP